MVACIVSVEESKPFEAAGGFLDGVGDSISAGFGFGGDAGGDALVGGDTNVSVGGGLGFGGEDAQVGGDANVSGGGGLGLSGGISGPSMVGGGEIGTPGIYPAG